MAGSKVSVDDVVIDMNDKDNESTTDQQCLITDIIHRQTYPEPDTAEVLRSTATLQSEEKSSPRSSRTHHATTVIDDLDESDIQDANPGIILGDEIKSFPHSDDSLSSSSFPEKSDIIDTSNKDQPLGASATPSGSGSEHEAECFDYYPSAGQQLGGQQKNQLAASSAHQTVQTVQSCFAKQDDLNIRHGHKEQVDDTSPVCDSDWRYKRLGADDRKCRKSEDEGTELQTFSHVRLHSDYSSRSKLTGVAQGNDDEDDDACGSIVGSAAIESQRKQAHYGTFRSEEYEKGSADRSWGSAAVSPTRSYHVGEYRRLEEEEDDEGKERDERERRSGRYVTSAWGVASRRLERDDLTLSKYDTSHTVAGSSDNKSKMAGADSLDAEEGSVQQSSTSSVSEQHTVMESRAPVSSVMYLPDCQVYSASSFLDSYTGYGFPGYPSSASASLAAERAEVAKRILRKKAKKEKVEGKFHKAEDCPEYKGNMTVEELVAFIDKGIVLAGDQATHQSNTTDELSSSHTTNLTNRNEASQPNQKKKKTSVSGGSGGTGSSRDDDNRISSNEQTGQSSIMSDDSSVTHNGWLTPALQKKAEQNKILKNKNLKQVEVVARTEKLREKDVNYTDMARTGLGIPTTFPGDSSSSSTAVCLSSSVSTRNVPTTHQQDFTIDTCSDETDSIVSSLHDGFLSDTGTGSLTTGEGVVLRGAAEFVTVSKKKKKVKVCQGTGNHDDEYTHRRIDGKWNGPVQQSSTTPSGRPTAAAARYQNSSSSNPAYSKSALRASPSTQYATVRPALDVGSGNGRYSQVVEEEVKTVDLGQPCETSGSKSGSRNNEPGSFVKTATTYLSSTSPAMTGMNYAATAAAGTSALKGLAAVSAQRSATATASNTAKGSTVIDTACDRHTVANVTTELSVTPVIGASKPISYSSIVTNDVCSSNTPVISSSMTSSFNCVNFPSLSPASLSGVLPTRRNSTGNATMVDEIGGLSETSSETASIKSLSFAVSYASIARGVCKQSSSGVKGRGIEGVVRASAEPERAASLGAGGEMERRRSLDSGSLLLTNSAESGVNTANTSSIVSQSGVATCESHRSDTAQRGAVLEECHELSSSKAQSVPGDLTTKNNKDKDEDSTVPDVMHARHSSTNNDHHSREVNDSDTASKPGDRLMTRLMMPALNSGARQIGALRSDASGTLPIVTQPCDTLPRGTQPMVTLPSGTHPIATLPSSTLPSGMLSSGIQLSGTQSGALQQCRSTAAVVRNAVPIEPVVFLDIGKNRVDRNLTNDIGISFGFEFDATSLDDVCFSDSSNTDLNLQTCSAMPCAEGGPARGGDGCGRTCVTSGGNTSCDVPTQCALDDMKNSASGDKDNIDNEIVAGDSAVGGKCSSPCRVNKEAKLSTSQTVSSVTAVFPSLDTGVTTSDSTPATSSADIATSPISSWCETSDNNLAVRCAIPAPRLNPITPPREGGVASPVLSSPIQYTANHSRPIDLRSGTSSAQAARAPVGVVPPLHYDRTKPVSSGSSSGCVSHSKSDNILVVGGVTPRVGGDFIDKQIKTAEVDGEEVMRPGTEESRCRNIENYSRSAANSSASVCGGAKGGNFDLFGAQAFLYKGYEDTLAERNQYPGDVIQYNAAAS